MYSPHTFLAVSVVLFLVSPSYGAGLTKPEDIVSAYSLTVSTTLPFPTATLAPSDAGSFLVSSWSLNKNRIQNEPDDLSFVADPFPSSTSSSSSSVNTSSVLQVTYPGGSFGDSNGGSQFFSLFNGSIAPQTMLLSYEVAFDQGFQFVKGGKLPGLRGGTDTNGCEGGSKPNGTDCWSTRLMWRTAGEGEVYAYIPTSNNLCSQSDIKCNDDFGTSIGRGSFSFKDGAWNRITLLVQLNTPGDVSNGNVKLYYNDVQAISHTGLQLRSSTDVLAGGLFFSTFFGGNDESWESPTDQHTFYRNFRLWASDRASNSTASSAASAYGFSEVRWWCIVVLTLGVGFL